MLGANMAAGVGGLLGAVLAVRALEPRRLATLVFHVRLQVLHPVINAGAVRTGEQTTGQPAVSFPLWNLPPIPTHVIAYSLVRDRCTRPMHRYAFVARVYTNSRSISSGDYNTGIGIVVVDRIRRSYAL